MNSTKTIARYNEKHEALSSDHLINDEGTNNETSDAFKSQLPPPMDGNRMTPKASGARRSFRAHRLANAPRRAAIDCSSRQQRQQQKLVEAGAIRLAAGTASCCCSSTGIAIESLDCCAGSPPRCSAALDAPPPQASSSGERGGGGAASPPPSHVSTCGICSSAPQLSQCSSGDDSSTIEQPGDFCELHCNLTTVAEPAEFKHGHHQAYKHKQSSTIAGEGCGSHLDNANELVCCQSGCQRDRCASSGGGGGGGGLVLGSKSSIDLKQARAHSIGILSQPRETVCQLVSDGGGSLILNCIKTDLVARCPVSGLRPTNQVDSRVRDENDHHQQTNDTTTKSLTRLSGVIKSFLGDNLRSFGFVRGVGNSDKFPLEKQTTTETSKSPPLPSLDERRQFPTTPRNDSFVCSKCNQFVCSTICDIDNCHVTGEHHHHCLQQRQSRDLGQLMSSNINEKETVAAVAVAPPARHQEGSTISESMDGKMSTSACGSGDLVSENNNNKHSIEDTIKKQLQEQQKHQIQLRQQVASHQKLKQNKFGLFRHEQRLNSSQHCSSVGPTIADLPSYDHSSPATSMGIVSNLELNQLSLCARQARNQSNDDQHINLKSTNRNGGGNNNNNNELNSESNMATDCDDGAGDRGEGDDANQGGGCKVTVNSNSNNNNNASRSAMTTIKKRENWDKNIEFLLAVIGFAVDLGNVWRFPYICYKNGGGAFLIPYTIMFILGGLPIFYLEMSLGQYFSCGCLTVWRRVCPMAKGIGYAMCVLNFFTGLYYNTIISWAVFFFVESFTYKLPWTSCNNPWNSPGCRSIEQRQEMRRDPQSPYHLTPGNQSNFTYQTHYTSPTKDYFEREVLKVHLSSGIDDLGSIRQPLAIYLAIVFICIYFAIWKGVKSTGKAVWITALLPYFVLIPLLIRGVFLEGAWLGIKYYLYPNWYKIFDVDVWVEAAKQIYFSLGPGFGTLMALSSYNKFNHNCRRDALIAASVNYFASFIAGLVIFAVLGYMATIETTSIEEVATEGPGLVFQVYPEGLATMQFSSMWSVLFFIMVITLGIDSTFGGLESVITGLCDEYPRVLRAHRGIFIGLLIIIIYLCSLPTTTQGGNYVIYILESYGTSLSLLFIVLIETIIVCWLYGTDKFCENLKEMYGETPGPYWRICWKYISPTILLLIFIAACGQELDKYCTLQFESYIYPSWAPTFGLLMTGSSVCCVPVYAIYYIKTKTTGSSLWQRLKIASRPIEVNDQKVKDRCTDANTDKITV